MRTQLKESKSFENILQEQISQAKEKYKGLYEEYEKVKVLSSGEEVEAELRSLQRKMVDVKDAFGSIDVLKLQFIEKVWLNSLKCSINAKQKHLGCKKVRGQSEATCKQAGATKSFDIS